MKKMRFVLVFIFLLSFVMVSKAQSQQLFRVYMTFEDGPTRAYTPEILDILAQYNAKATFLIAGFNIAGNEDLIQREVLEGHALINHLWDEPGVYYGSDPDKVRESYIRTEASIRDALGDVVGIYDNQVKMYWQPGGGAQPLPAIEGVTAITYNWNVNSDDCGYRMPDVNLETDEFDNAVLENVLGNPITQDQFFNAYDFGDGVVIAFHDINRVTARVLPTIITELQKGGATFLALPRAGDAVNTMPIVIGAPPPETEGIAGTTYSAQLIVDSNLRSSTDRLSKTNIIDVIPTGTTVLAVGRTYNFWRVPSYWIQVQYGDKIGWVWRDNLRVYGAIPFLPTDRTQ